MNAIRLMSSARYVLSMAGAMSLLVFVAHAEQPDSTGCYCPNAGPATTLAKPDEGKYLPHRGKVRSETAPPKAVFGMIWNDTKSQRDYIFNGNEWVPHDNTVDDYNAAKKHGRHGGGK